MKLRKTISEGFALVGHLSKTAIPVIVLFTGARLLCPATLQAQAKLQQARTGGKSLRDPDRDPNNIGVVHAGARARALNPDCKRGPYCGCAGCCCVMQCMVPSPHTRSPE